MALDPIYGPMNSTVSTYGGLAVDGRNLSALKADASKATPESIRETAKQFESLFMRELIKSMRDATQQTGMLENEGTKLGTDMYDQQLSIAMSGQKGGLGELIAKQLAQQMGVDMNAAGADGIPDTLALGASNSLSSLERNASDIAAKARKLSSALDGVAPKLKKAPTETQADFVRKHSEIANKVEAATGIPASFMIGQAGHESGWGKHEIKLKNGQSAHNLFGIKAGASWKGKVAEVTTTEYVDGVAQKKVAKFRAYGSYDEAFADYAKLISESPRYEKVRSQGKTAQAFASGLQKAGYATDPEYAAKLSRAINTTLHLRRVQT
ncbi:flagellar assembly peptidoglycan hydrolase FlgJ [Curvibacter sp. APW13]|uniref:flagellar assembly peptidoglycan hydrolase FlgJ n=1 Tax=Curvibacter sp. APW13 TaxID=3077236 RepID=UPI0028DFCCC1|nr:flagellar assembly peptidoglycan hydrolase FlgJ [Curvibacter sp. APW13]MDT8993047.1 flagellar assembly peptidoglycan hydrolase FlgJ [Curvibacter sp. APW13]